jgi:hypothetical protein
MWTIVSIFIAQGIAGLIAIIKIWNRVNVHEEQIETIKKTFTKERDELNHKLDKINDNLLCLTKEVAELIGTVKSIGANVLHDGK